MKKIIIAPDSFKGTLSASEVCQTIADGLSDYFSHEQICQIPIADGGEGTVSCCLQIEGAVEKKVETVNALMQNITASYAMIEDTAIIEMASVAGYSHNLNSEGIPTINPLKTTTYGLGAMIRDAISQGARQIIIGLGGSCTNDAGVGMAASLGTEFINSEGSPFLPAGDTLDQIASFDTSKTATLLSGIEIIGMHDTRAVMFGPNGAAYVYAPQKGATNEEVVLFDNGLQALAGVIREKLGRDISTTEGTGAAGALGAGICAFLGGKLVSGIDHILSMAGYEKQLNDCAVVITGEGRFDRQTLSGKAVSGIAARAHRQNVPVLVIAGQKEDSLPELSEFGIDAVWTCGELETGLTAEDLKKSCIKKLKSQAVEAGRYIKEHYF